MVNWPCCSRSPGLWSGSIPRWRNLNYSLHCGEATERGRVWDSQLIFFRLYPQWPNTHFTRPDCFEFLSPPRNELGTKNAMHKVLGNIRDPNCVLQDDTDLVL